MNEPVSQDANLPEPIEPQDPASSQAGENSFGQYQVIPRLNEEQLKNIENFQNFELPKREEEEVAEKKTKISPKELPKQLVIRVHKISFRWKLLKTMVLGYYLFVLVVVLDWNFHFVHHLELFSIEERMFLHHPIWIVPAAIIGILLFLFFLRPKYLEIDTENEFFFYSGYFFGKQKYFFYDVAKVEFEVDMTKALMDLKYSEFCRIYLQLIDKRHLLVTEGLGQKLSDLAQTLADTLQVVVNSLHRVGVRRTTKISLGRYNIIEELSHGGMGKVFLAKDDTFDREVALKILPASLAMNTIHTKGFAREIDILQKLSHPNIVKIYDVGRETCKGTDVYFFAMEYLKGFNLSSLIPSKNQFDEIDYKRIAKLGFQCAVALDYIHENRIYHRDIKPSNIMVRVEDDEEKIVLIDFGIAKDVTTVYQQVESGSRQIDRSHVKGSPAYMSPEQFMPDRSVDHRTDIYSLGVTLYQLLTGQLPVGGGGMTTLGKRVPSWDAKDPTLINPKIPEALEIILLHALEREKNKRYQRAIDMAEDLQLWLHEQPIKSAKLSWFQRTKRKIKRIWRLFWRF